MPKRLFYNFLFNQRQVAEINLELKEHEERSQLTNRGLQKEFDESYSATQALEAKVKVHLTNKFYTQQLI